MSDGSSGEDRRHNQTEKELASKVLNVQNKRFYVDVKENSRGRFIKLAEVSLGGRKSRLILSMSAAVAFRDHLDKFVKFFDGLASGEERQTANGNGQLRSEVIVRDSRFYYLELKENIRGRFLRVSQTVARGMSGIYLQIALPAQGMAQLRDALSEFIDKYAEGYLTDVENIELPESKHVRAGNNRIFYFDVGHNRQGPFVFITEVKRMSGSRSSIAVPMTAWKSFRDILDELQEKMTAKITANEAERTVKAEVEETDEKA